ncbi:E3 ubiquitin-protein ligase HOS1-like [Bidens hawaiensis]|uniref:E3 ubiquitin-protein ligase HOS1-like n=1 Tax=Bidens hawaiensis TaxID=980011 RepID=UPI0040492D3B
MESRRLIDGGASDSNNNINNKRNTTTNLSLQVNYSFPKVQEALEHLASIDPIQLCNEAKVEYCRATRDLRSCGRCVQSVLTSCGHASLCEECTPRCDVCPICRFPIPKTGNRLTRRLFYECIEAGLISKRHDDRFQEKDCEKQPTAGVERLCSFFDVALENNLLSLICHYITDVCMDESAVSSDPIVALLLDEVVVKDWCKRTFKNIISDLKPIYSLDVEKLKEKSSVLLKFTVRLSGISTVLEQLESSFKDSLSAQLHDIYHLQESILKTNQHMEMMIWYTRHEFLEDLNRHESFSSWQSDVGERRSMAVKRAWPSPIETSSPHDVILFIDDALANLDKQEEYPPDKEYELEIAGLSLSRAKMEGIIGSYPFENIKSAIDILFLCGSSDLVVAKQATLLYYLFDRLWKIPDDKWRFCVDDFSATFNISRHSILESFTFYLLDDHSDEALQEACHLLPEIAGPTTHPKVAQVLLERQNPYSALMVLRWSGSDNGTELVSLNEAVTAVRVRVECGFLIEAFMYQRSVCTKVKTNKVRQLNDDFEDGLSWLEILVSEICLLCIRRNLVDRIIGLPWNFDEEKHLHKCLLDYALETPLTNIGSLLVVFYLQRYRYVEAYQIDRKIRSVEEDFISKNLVNEDVKNRMVNTQRLKAGLVDKSIQLLPEVDQEKVKNGEMTELTFPENNNNAPESPNLFSSSNLTSSYINTSFLLQSGEETPSPKSNLNDLTSYNTPVSKSVIKFDYVTTSATPLKEFNRGSSRIRKNKYLQNESVDQIPRSRNIASANLEDSPSSMSVLLKSKAFGKSARLSRLGKDAYMEDLMDMSWSNKDERLPVQTNMNGGPRWRSDDASDHEDQQSPDRLTGGVSTRGLRRSRLTRI